MLWKLHIEQDVEFNICLTTRVGYVTDGSAIKDRETDTLGSGSGMSCFCSCFCSFGPRGSPSILTWFPLIGPEI